MIKVEGLKTNIFYHYTSIEAAKSIISSNSIWLTHYKDLDDKKEFRRGTKIILKELNKKFLNSTGPLSKALSDLENVPSKEHYIFCLCPDAENDYNWDRYADKGNGVAIGFDAQSLLSLYYEDLKRKPFDIIPVDYEIENFRENVRDKISRLSHPVFCLVNSGYLMATRDTAAIPNYPKFRNEISERLADGSRVKSKKYQPENEWRLVHSPEYGYNTESFVYTQKLRKRRAILQCTSLPIVQLKFRKARKKDKKCLFECLSQSGYAPTFSEPGKNSQKTSG